MGSTVEKKIKILYFAAIIKPAPYVRRRHRRVIDLKVINHYSINSKKKTIYCIVIIIIIASFVCI
jgi:hypothetical protein